jgi:hypothetical protein
MWAYEYKFFTKDVHDGCVTLEYGVEVKFDQSSHAIHCDQNLIDEKSYNIKIR